MGASPLTTHSIDRQLNKAMQKAMHLRAEVDESVQQISEPQSAAEACAITKERSERGLLYIGLFKVSKSIGCILIGAMCLHLIHSDLGTVAMKTIEWLGMDPNGHIASIFLDRADLVSGHDLRITGALSFAGAVTYAVEGTGLMLHKVWAEYFTVVLTTLGLPWEIFEMLRHFTIWKTGLFVANILVLAYLIWLLRRKRVRDHRPVIT